MSISIIILGQISFMFVDSLTYILHDLSIQNIFTFLLAALHATPDSFGLDNWGAWHRMLAFEFDC